MGATQWDGPDRLQWIHVGTHLALVPQRQRELAVNVAPAARAGGARLGRSERFVNLMGALWPRAAARGARGGALTAQDLR